MSSNLMDTEAGGEQTQYEGEASDVQPPKGSAGQMGNSADHTTEDPSKTSEGAQQQAERGEKTAENIRYGQTISEGGMGGMTNQTGSSEDAVYGRQEYQQPSTGAAQDRTAAGYGGEKDMDTEIGA